MKRITLKRALVKNNNIIIIILFCLSVYACTAPPGPLTGCAIRLPKDQERHSGTGSRHHNHHHQQHHHQRRTSSVHDGLEDKDLATISCTLDNDGGVRPVTYSLEIYESNDLATTFYGSVIKINITNSPRVPIKYTACNTKYNRKYRYAIA